MNAQPDYPTDKLVIKYLLCGGAVGGLIMGALAMPRQPENGKPVSLNGIQVFLVDGLGFQAALLQRAPKKRPQFLANLLHHILRLPIGLNMRCAFDFKQLFILRAAGVGEHPFGHI